jgi:hypothetical protein
MPAEELGNVVGGLGGIPSVVFGTPVNGFRIEVTGTGIPVKGFTTH